MRQEEKRPMWVSMTPAAKSPDQDVLCFLKGSDVRAVLVMTLWSMAFWKTQLETGQVLSLFASSELGTTRQSNNFMNLPLVSVK